MILSTWRTLIDFMLQLCWIMNSFTFCISEKKKTLVIYIHKRVIFKIEVGSFVYPLIMLKLLSFSFDNKKIRENSYLFSPHVLCYLLPLADFKTCYLSLIFSNLIMMYLNMVFSVVLLFVSSTDLHFSSSLDKFNCNFFKSFFPL